LVACGSFVKKIKIHGSVDIKKNFNLLTPTAVKQLLELGSVGWWFKSNSSLEFIEVYLCVPID
jgi:hypothetical protein